MSPNIGLIEVSKIYPYQQSFDFGVSISRLFTRRPEEKNRPPSWKTAVDKVSLSIQTGERLGIVGRNGAGKSTLLSMIAGVISPSSGTISIEGHVTSILTLGLGLREDLSGRENIYLDGEVQGSSRSEIDQVIDEVIAFADIGEFIDYPVRTYSTGMKARLAFGMTFHVEPEILLIDEALSVGDAAFSVKATQKIRELCNKGKIVIIVSHSMENVVEICNRCLWMEDGRIVMDGDPAVVTKAYIDSVRKKDEAVILERFRAYVGARSFRHGCEIDRLEARQGSSCESKSILKAGEDCQIRIAMRIVGAVTHPDVRLTITRLDGLILADTRLTEDADTITEPIIGRVAYAISMRPLVLSPAIYRITIELLDGDEIVAERSTIVEVIAEKVPTGGRTALLYPCSVDSQPVSQ